MKGVKLDYVGDALNWEKSFKVRLNLKMETSRLGDKGPKKAKVR